jgi:hypothetical protein
MMKIFRKLLRMVFMLSVLVGSTRYLLTLARSV